MARRRSRCKAAMAKLAKKSNQREKERRPETAGTQKKGGNAS